MNEDLRELVCIVNSKKQYFFKDDKLTANELLAAALQNDTEKIKQIIDRSRKEIFKYKYSHMKNQTIITIACTNDSITAATLDKLICLKIYHYGYLDLVDENWYYWEPIHYAASVGDPSKLEVVVSRIEKTKLNTLTAFSENALHVLLEYGQHNKSYTVQFTNSWDSKSCTVVPTEKSSTVKCAKILIQSGIDINHNNYWNETPILLAIKYRQIKIIYSLLTCPTIDLDFSKDFKSRLSPRELLKQYEIYYDALPPNTAVFNDSVKTLFTYLKFGSEDFFLKYNNENIRQYANILDGDNEWNTSGTMLQFCFRRGFIEYVHVEEPLESISADIYKTLMLKMFCMKGYARCIEHLLNNDATSSVTNRKFPTSLLESSIKLNYYPFLTILLEHKSRQVSSSDLYSVLCRADNANFNLSNNNTRHVLFILINKLEEFQKSEKGDLINYDHCIVLAKVLDLFLQTEITSSEDQKSVCQILKLGASLTSTIDKQMTVERIPSKVLEAHLDDCLSSDYKVCFDSLILDDGAKYSETKAIHNISHDYKKQELLNHPVLIFLIHNKWLKLSWYFYIDIIFYFMFLLSIYFYILNQQIDRPKLMIRIAFLFFLIIHTFKEVVQLVLYRLKYFKDLSNYLELSAILCCYVTYLSKNEICMVIAILSSTLVFLLMFGQLPRFTKYMIIFSSTKYFFEYSFFYLLQFVSFAICFFIVFPREEVVDETGLFGEILNRMFDSLIFFTGQLDDETLKSKKFPVFGRILMTVFIFCMTIILNNLLVGLIVTDMDMIQKTSKLYKQIKMVKYIVRMQSFIKRVQQLRTLIMLKRFIGSTDIFEKGRRKFIDLNICGDSVFDDDDKTYIKEIILKKQSEYDPSNTKTLQGLYEHILNSAAENHRRRFRDQNQDILQKLLALEEKISGGNRKSKINF